MNKDKLLLLSHLNTSELINAKLKADYYKSKVDACNIAFSCAETDLQTAKNNLNYYIKNRDYYADQIKITNRTLSCYKTATANKKLKDILSKDDIDRYITKCEKDTIKFKDQKQFYFEKISEANNALDEAKVKYNLAKANRQIAYKYLSDALNEELKEMQTILNMVNKSELVDTLLCQADIIDFIEFKLNNTEDKSIFYGGDYEL